MRFTLQTFFLAMIAGLGICSGSAANVYIAQNAAGAASGADCGNARAAAFFNTPANWGSGATQIGPGSVVHLCGTFTGAAGSTALTFQGSGTAGNPITLLFEPGAVLQAPYWAASKGGFGGGAITMSGFGSNARSYVVVDGGSNGTIENTANGDGMANQQDTIAVSAYACQNCTMRNVKISNIYVHNNPASQTTDETRKSCLEFSGSNWTINNNKINDAGWCFLHGYTNGDTNIQIYNNEIANFTHGYALMGTQSGGPAITNVFFHDNYLHDTANWDTNACNYHHGGMHVFGANGSTINGLHVYNNFFGGDWGRCQTGQVFVEAGANDAGLSNSVWFNNVFMETGTGPSYTGMFGLFSGKSGTTKVLNNTCVHGNATDGTTCFYIQYVTGLTFKNNAAHNVQNPVGIDSSTFNPADIDYNYYGNTCAGGNCFIRNGTFTGSLLGWKAACVGCELHSVANVNALLTSLGLPQAGAPLLGIGANLSSLATGNLAALARDTSAGNTRATVVRPAGLTWDMGAFQVSGGGTPAATPPSPPTALSALVR